MLVAISLPACGGRNTPAIYLPGDLDPGFSGDGKQTAFSGNTSQSWAVGLQSSGRIVVAGSTSVGSTAIGMVALDASGGIDGTFGTVGTVVTDPSSGQGQAFAMLIQPDNKIVLAGEVDTGNGSSLAVLRYNENGSLDTTFDGDGIATLAIGGFATEGRAIGQQTDGKLVVAASAYNGSNTDFAVVRFDSDGLLDMSFDADGYALIDFSGGQDLPSAVSIDSYGKIVVAGYSATGSPHDMALTRLNADGSLDTEFDTDGKLLLVVGEAQSAVRAIQIQPDDKIVGVGGSISGGFLVFTVIRLNTDGSYDGTFGTAGIATSGFDANHAEPFAALLQGDGKILTGGYTNQAPGGFALVRFKSTGEIDSEYGASGQVVTSFDIGGSATIRVFALQGDGKVVAVGTGSPFLIARYFN